MRMAMSPSFRMYWSGRGEHACGRWGQTVSRTVCCKGRTTQMHGTPEDQLIREVFLTLVKDLQRQSRSSLAPPPPKKKKKKEYSPLSQTSNWVHHHLSLSVYLFHLENKTTFFPAQNWGGCGCLVFLVCLRVLLLLFYVSVCVYCLSFSKDTAPSMHHNRAFSIDVWSTLQIDKHQYHHPCVYRKSFNSLNVACFTTMKRKHRAHHYLEWSGM